MQQTFATLFQSGGQIVRKTLSGPQFSSFDDPEKESGATDTVGEFTPRPDLGITEWKESLLTPDQINSAGREGKQGRQQQSDSQDQGAMTIDEVCP